MSLIYREDWAPGNSLFTSMYYYDWNIEGDDPLYLFMYQAEGVYINGDGRLDKNPAFTGPFQDYQTAGIWLEAPVTFGDNGFWDGQQGNIEVLYYPTTTSLTQNAGNTCPLAWVTDTFATGWSVEANLDDAYLRIFIRLKTGFIDHQLTGAPMPVAGEPYKVRVSWTCGTYDFDTDTVADDGFLRLWVNDELIYEAENIRSQIDLTTTPANQITDVRFAFAGLLGPLDYFEIRDDIGEAVVLPEFRSGVTERPQAWIEITRKELP